MKKLAPVGILLMTLALAACGSSKTDRALSGAGIGAGAGAVGGALMGNPAGAATGALTDQDDINLGKPWWK